MKTHKERTILLTFDVEDWFQVENLKPWIPQGTWHERELRVDQNIHRILDLLEGIPSTFFILGWVAEKRPHLVRLIAERGHEVASHGYGHQLCHDMHVKDLENDLTRSKQLLEDIVGSEVVGYRAPSFSINPQVLGILEQCGYRYDSSYNSFQVNSRYGHLDVTRYVSNGHGFQITDNFHELPLSNMMLRHRTLPWSGGGYFRLVPYPIFRRGLQSILGKQGFYLFYLHPWEIDAAQPRVAAADRLSRFRHYYNLKSTYKKLHQLLTDHVDCHFSTCREFLQV